MDKILEHTEHFTLTPGSFDRYSNITPYAVFDIFQEVAAQHANILDANFNKTNSEFFWLLIRSKYEIIKSITKPIKVIVKTWPLKPERIDYEREYQVFDLDNNLLIKGSSKWCIYDSVKNTISRETFHFSGSYLNLRNFDQPLKKIKPLPLEELEHVYNYKVMPSFLDINNHVNNAKYSIMVFDALNLSKNESIKTIEFNFNKELKLNDIVSIYKKKIENTYFVYGYLNNVLHFASKVEVTK